MRGEAARRGRRAKATWDGQLLFVLASDPLQVGVANTAGTAVVALFS